MEGRMDEEENINVCGTKKGLVQRREIKWAK